MVKHLEAGESGQTRLPPARKDEGGRAPPERPAPEGGATHWELTSSETRYKTEKKYPNFSALLPVL